MLATTPAGGMLDFLNVRFHHQRARHNDRTRERHKARPAPDNARADDQYPQADLEFALKGSREPFGECRFWPVQSGGRRPPDQQCIAFVQALP